ncbi:MAG: tRNA-specific 2-thiouridylase [Bacteroidales bacterium]|jgi:tRNA-specific 2-thiouridylase|nr:tRNA-specific 2-thiouridylase [Bacteroidales bacterium]
MMNKKRVLLAMSGGINSSVSATLLKQQGYEVVGITARLWRVNTTLQQGICCNNEAISEACSLAMNLKIDHEVMDFTGLFKDIDLRNFIDEYLYNRTPDPCLLCSLNLKWKVLIKNAEELQCDYIATGHYATIKQENGRYFISKGKDLIEDQSYALWGLSQEHLAKTIFPLGNYTKDEIHQKAMNAGLEHLIQKQDNDDICFFSRNDDRWFLQKHAPYLEKGFLPERFAGKQEGFPFYSPKQKKRFLFSFGFPKRASKTDTKTKRTLWGKKKDLLLDTIIIRDYNLSKYQSIPDEFIGEVKTQHNENGQQALIKQYDNYILIQFETPIAVATLGRAAVIYKNNDMIGGGIIDVL